MKNFLSIIQCSTEELLDLLRLARWLFPTQPADPGAFGS